MKWYSVKEVAERFNVTEKTVARWLRDGKYPHAKKNGKWSIPECCLDEDGHAQGGETADTESAKTDPELLKLRQEKERLVVEKEVKTLKAEIAGIWTPADQAKIAEAQKGLDVASAGLAEREGELAEREQELLEGRELLTADRGNQEKDEVKWQGLLEVVKDDLQTIFTYYKRVCGHWPVKEEVLFEGLKLKDFWGEPGEVAPDIGEVYEDGELE